MHTSTGNLMLDPTPKARAGVGASGVKWTLPGRRPRFIALGTAGGFLSQQVGER